MAPEGADFVLTADVPYGEGDVFVFYRFHVESDRRNRRHNLAQFQFVQDRSLTGGIQTHLVKRRAGKGGGERQRVFMKIESRQSDRCFIIKLKNKPGRVISCVAQAEIVVFGGFSLMATDGRTDGQTLL